VCQCFNFTWWLLDGLYYKRRLPRDWYLGSWKDVSQRQYCSLCRLVCSTAKQNRSSNDLSGLSRVMVSLRRHESPIWALEVRLSRRDSFGWETPVQSKQYHQILFGEENVSTSGNYLTPLDSARIIPPKMDLEIVKRWILECDSNHEKSCRDTDINIERPVNAKVIEVDTLRIIPAPTKCRYIALSYTWGGVNMDMMDCVWSNRSGVLDLTPVFGMLPKTIRDAICLVKSLGERYIWIDSVCICQQSAHDKNEQIAQMDRIYSSAVFTIVAAAGKDANAGLPGVQERSRIPFQVTEKVGSYVLRTALLNEPRNGIIDSAPWNRRGWTYQERLLSCRCLIFTYHQVYFQCRLGTWSEDTNRIRMDVESTTGTRLASWLRPQKLARIRKFSLVDPFEDFIADYTYRRFSYHSDRLKASIAVLNLFSSMYESPILWGLVERAFERFLIWDYKIDTSQAMPARIRRIREFPTWSWSSWSGGTTYGSNKLVLCSVVTWYKICENRDLCRVSNDKMRTEKQDEAGGLDIMRDWRPEQYKCPDIDLEMYDAGKIPGERCSGVLVFWTVSTFLFVEPVISSLRETKSPFIHCQVLDDGRIPVNVKPITLSRNWWTSQTQDHSSFIVVAHDLRNIILFMVEWQGCVALRVGQVVVHRSVWQRLLNKNWILVHLG
jgi:hypothetical protein